MRLSVLVPTYRRPAHLVKCLRALEQQTRRPEQVVVVARHDDAQTRELLEQFTCAVPIEPVFVAVPGQVAALNTGLERVRGDVVAITDDDAEPHADWLQRIAQHFQSNPNIAGVGGRDFLHDGHAYEVSPVVGKIQWFGRHIGNHHSGVGPARYVDVLKGANMSYRMSAVGGLRFDTRLLGAGAQICNDMSFALRLRRRGWQLLYDPAIAVEHYCGERFDDDGRVQRSYAAIRNESHNETVAVMEFLPPHRWPIFLLWALVVGHRGLPGPIQCLRLSLMGKHPWNALAPVAAGRCLGVVTVLRNHH